MGKKLLGLIILKLNEGLYFMRRKIFVILFLFSIKPLTVFCQDTVHLASRVSSKGHFLMTGISGGWFAVKDLETSPLIYRGFLPGVDIGGLFYGKRMLTSFQYNFSWGNQATRNYPVNDANRAKAYNNYLMMDVYTKVNTENYSKSDIYIGAKVGLLANFRSNLKFNNASFNYEGFLTFGPTVLWEKEISMLPRQVNMAFFRWPFHQRNIKWSASLFVPVVSGVERPPYTTIENFVDGVTPSFRLDQLKIVSFNALIHVAASLGMQYYLQNGNRLQLSYQWYYYNYYPSVNQVRGVAGIFSFSFLFRLNKK